MKTRLKKRVFCELFKVILVIINVPVLNHIEKKLKKSGLVILDAHIHPLDILLTARHLHQNFHVKINMAIVGYAFHVPIMKQVVNWFGRKYKINFLPVYRKEELAPKDLALKFFCSFYPKEIDLKKRSMANKKFIKTATRLCQKPGEVIIIAPYGSTTLFGHRVKNGVKKILLQNSLYLTSITRWHFPKIGFKTHFGRVSSFKPTFNREKIEARIQRDFSNLPLPVWLQILKSRLFRPKAWLKVPNSVI